MDIHRQFMNIRQTKVTWEQVAAIVCYKNISLDFPLIHISTEQSPSSEADSRSAGQEIFRLL